LGGLRERYLRGLKELFSVWKAPTPEVREILSLLPIAKDIAWAIQGQPGTGKSSFVRAMAKIFYGGRYANVKLDESQMPDDVFYYLDLPKLLREGVEEVHPRPILTSWLKWANEMMTRASQTVKNACLGVLAEGEVAYKGSVLKAERGIFIDDYNRYLVDSLSDVDWAFCDRHDTNVNIPMTGFREDVELMMMKYGGGRHERDISKLVEPVLSLEEMKGICEEVEGVEVPIEVALWAVMLMQVWKVCKHDRSVASPSFRIDCRGCEFNGEPCSHVEAPLSTRVIDSLIALCKARAWKDGRSRVEVDDVVFILPYVINHRLRLKPEVASRYLNEEEYARQMVRSVLERKQRLWREAAQNYVKVAKEPLREASKALELLERAGKQDLVVRELAEWGLAIFRDRSQKAMEEIGRFVESGEPYTLEEVEETLKIVEGVDEDLAGKVRKMRERLVFRMEVDRDGYYGRLVPLIAEFDGEVAGKMAEPFGAWRRLEIEGEGVILSERADQRSHRVEITFRRSGDAERFRSTWRG